MTTNFTLDEHGRIIPKPAKEAVVVKLDDEQFAELLKILKEWIRVINL